MRNTLFWVAGLVYTIGTGVIVPVFVFYFGHGNFNTELVVWMCAIGWGIIAGFCGWKMAKGFGK